jgi:hypothetical protein
MPQMMYLRLLKFFVIYNITKANICYPNNSLIKFLLAVKST